MRRATASVAHWATTGGSTPAAIYRNLAVPPLRDRVPWELVQLWWGDDRFVPADHPLSNAKVALADLLEIGALSGESGTGGIRGRRRRSAHGWGPDPRRERPPHSDRQGNRSRGRTDLGRAAVRGDAPRRWSRPSRADGPSSISSSSVSERTATSCQSSLDPRRSTRTTPRWRCRRRRISNRTSPGSPSTRVSSTSRAGSSSSHTARRRRRSSRRSSGRCATIGAGRPSWRAAPGATWILDEAAASALDR